MTDKTLKCVECQCEGNRKSCVRGNLNVKLCDACLSNLKDLLEKLSAYTRVPGSPKPSL